MKKYSSASRLSMLLVVIWGNLTLLADNILVLKFPGEIVPEPQPASTQFEALALGENHFLAVNKEGSLSAWGNPAYGALNVPGGSNFVQAAATRFRSAALTSLGELWLWGNGQNPFRFPNRFYKDLDAGGTHFALLQTNGIVVINDLSGFLAPLNPSITNGVAISTSEDHNLVLLEDGSIKSFGTHRATIPTPPKTTSARMIAAGAHHGLALLDSGELIAWGDNTYGQLDVPQLSSRITHIDAGGDVSLALTETGEFAVWGRTEMLDLRIPDTVESASLGAVGPDGIALVTEDPFAIITPPALSEIQSRTTGFTVIPYGLPNARFEWSFKEQPLPNATTETLAPLDSRSREPGEYTVSVQGNNGSTSSAKAWVMNPPEIKNSPEDRVVAGGTALTLEYQVQTLPPTFYYWSRNGLALPLTRESTLSIPQVGPEHDGVFQLIAMNPSGQATSSTVDIKVDSPPAVRIAFDQTTYRPQDRVGFKAIPLGRGPFRFEWFYRNTTSTFSSGTNSVLSFFPIDTRYLGPFFVKAFNEFGEGRSENIWIPTETAPVLTASPESPKMVPAGTMITLKPELFSAFPMQYQWSDEARNPLPNATMPFLEILAKTTPQTVYLEARNQYGKLEIPFVILPFPQLEILFSSPDMTGHVGATLDIRVDFTGPEGSILQWYFNGEILEGENNVVLRRNLDLNTIGTYQAQITDPFGNSVLSDIIELSIVPDPPSLLFSEAQLFREGQRSSLTVTSRSFPHPSIQWFQDGREIAETDLTLDWPAISSEDQGLYKIKATNPLGVAEREIGVITSPDHPGEQLLAWGKVNGIQALLNNSTLKVRDAAVSDRHAALIFEDGTILTDDEPFDIFSVSQFDLLGFGGDIRIRTIAGNGWALENFNFKPADGLHGFYNFHTVARAYRGDFALLADLKGNLLYPKDPVFFRHLVPVFDSPARHFVLTDTLAGVLKKNGSVTTWGDGLFQHFNGPYRQIAASSSEIIGLLEDGRLEWLHKSNNTGDIPSDLGTVQTLLGGGSEGTPGFFATLSDQGVFNAWGGLAENDIEWQGPLSGIRSIWASEQALFALSDDSMEVPLFTQPRDQSISFGNPFELSVSHPAARLTYQWEFKREALEGETNRVLKVSNATFDQTGEYRLKLSNDLISFYSQPAQVQVLAGPPVVRFNASHRRYHQGATLNLVPEVHASGPVTYQWFYGGNPIPGETAGTLIIQDLTEEHAGTYSVRVTQGNEATQSPDIAISIRPSPVPGRLFEWDTSTLSHQSFNYFNTIQVLVMPWDFGQFQRWVLLEDGSVLTWDNFSEPKRLFVSGNKPILKLVLSRNLLLALDVEGRIHRLEAPFGVFEEQSNLAMRVLDISESNADHSILYEDGSVEEWRLEGPYFHYMPEFDDPFVHLGDLGDWIALTLQNKIFFGDYGSSVIQFPENRKVRSLIQFLSRTIVLDDLGMLHFFGDPEFDPNVRFPNLPPLRTVFSYGFDSIVANDLNGFWIAKGSESPLVHPEVKKLHDFALSGNLALAVIDQGARILQQPSPATVLQGNSILLEIEVTGPNYELQWFHNTVPVPNATSSRLTLENADSSHIGNYFVRIKTPLAEFDSERVPVRVLTPPQFAPQQTEFTLSLGGSLEINPGIISTETYPHQWFKDDVQISSADINLRVDRADFSDAGEYFIRLNTPFGPFDSPRFQVVVEYPPIFIRQPNDAALLEGQSAMISFQARAVPSYEAVLLKEGQEVGRTTDSFFFLGEVHSALEGQYQVRLVSLLGSVESRKFLIRTYSKQPILLHHPEATSIVLGHPTFFEVDAYGEAPLNYQWTKNGQPISGATSARFSIPSPEPDDEGIYQVRVFNSAGEILSEEVPLRVRSERVFVVSTENHPVNPVPSFLVEPVELAGGRRHAYALQRDGIIVAWGDNSLQQLEVPPQLLARNVESGKDHGLALTAEESPKVVAWGANTEGQINVPPMVGPVLKIAAAGSSNAALTQEGFLWVWGGNQSARFFEVSDPELVTQIECSLGSAVILKSSSNSLILYSESFPMGRSIPIIPTGFSSDANFFYFGRGFGEVHRLDPETGKTQMVSVAHGPIQKINVYGGIVAMLNQNGPVRTVNWSSDWTYYYLEDLAAWPVVNAVEAGDGFVLGLQTPPRILESPKSITVSQGSTVSLSVKADTLSDPVFVWYHNQTPIPGANRDTLVFESVSLEDAGTYQVRIIDLYGTVDSQPLTTLTVFTDVPIFLTQPRYQAVAPGDPLELSVDVRSTQPIQFQWFFNQVALPGQTLPTLRIPTMSAENAGMYYVTATVPDHPPVSSIRAVVTFPPEFYYLDDSQANLHGNWTVSQGLNFFGGTALSLNTSDSGNHLEFILDLPLAGNYQVEWHRTLAGTSPWMEVVSGENRKILPAISNLINPEWFETGSFRHYQSGVLQLFVRDWSLPSAAGRNFYPSLDALRLTRLPQPPTGLSWQRIFLTREGDSLVIDPDIGGIQPRLYQWLFNNVPIPGAQERTLSFENLGPQNQGAYKLFVSNPDGVNDNLQTFIFVEPKVIASSINFEWSDGQLNIIGQEGWIIEWASTPEGPYEPSDLPAGQSWTIAPSEAGRFFRLKKLP